MRKWAPLTLNIYICDQPPCMYMLSIAAAKSSPITADGSLSLLGLWHTIPGSPWPWRLPSYPANALTSDATWLPSSPCLASTTISGDPFLYSNFDTAFWATCPSCPSALTPNLKALGLNQEWKERGREEEYLQLSFIFKKIPCSFGLQWKNTTHIKV